MHESLKLQQRASVDFMWAKKCHSESHAKKTSAVHGAPRSCGVKSGCPATKGMLWALPLLRGSTELPGTPGSRDSCPCLRQVCDNQTVFSSWMELVPGCYIVETDQGMCPKASEKEPLASWDGDSAPLGYCFVYLISQKVLRQEGRSRKYDCEFSRLQLWLRVGGKINRGGRDELPNRGAEDKVPICAKSTWTRYALEK